MSESKNEILSESEEAFCNLYINGGRDYAGKHCKCYTEVFGNEVKNISVASRRLLAQPRISSRIKALTEECMQETEILALKLQVSETLRAVMEETSTAQYTDKYGIDLSPAPLRAVTVNAAKALMELHPIRHGEELKLRIEGGNGVVFNVIVPESNSHED